MHIMSNRLRCHEAPENKPMRQTSHIIINNIKPTGVSPLSYRLMYYITIIIIISVKSSIIQNSPSPSTSKVIFPPSFVDVTSCVIMVVNPILIMNDADKKNENNVSHSPFSGNWEGMWKFWVLRAHVMSRRVVFTGNNRVERICPMKRDIFSPFLYLFFN